jgi:predicted metalloprotease with PDZ domain
MSLATLTRKLQTMRNLNWQSVLALAIVSLWLVPSMAQNSGEKDSAEQTINYHIDLTDAPRHYITVTADVPVEGETTTLMMAVWTPGSYLVREYPKHVVDLMAYDRRGNELPVTKTTKNRWVVSDTEKQKRIRVQYRVYCRESSVRTNWVDDRYAILNGGPTFITRPDMLDSPATVQLQMAEGWKRSATSLMPDGETSHRYRAESYHELVDSPIVAGNIEVFPFQASGVTHALVNVNDMGFWDGSRAVRDLAKLVEAQHKMWGLVPYDRYLFINVIKASGGGGLEHNNCCLLESSQFACTNEGSYRGFLSLCSHEFFHAWNVRRLRPSELANYNYEQENYTPSLWVAEGITTYYQDLMLARAGFTDESAMMGDLSGLVASVQMTPGRLKQSLRDSSHDAWIKYYRPEENSRYNEISYYSKGAIVAWLLDAEIRMSTDGQKAWMMSCERFTKNTPTVPDTRPKIFAMFAARLPERT